MRACWIAKGEVKAVRDRKALVAAVAREGLEDRKVLQEARDRWVLKEVEAPMAVVTATAHRRAATMITPNAPIISAFS